MTNSSDDALPDGADSPLYGQFTLSRRDLEVPAGFGQHNCNGWRLYSHASLPVHDLLDPQGSHLGYVVGFVILDGNLLLTPSAIELPPINDISEELIEQRLREMAGRYIFLLLPEAPGKSLAYPDPFSSLASVYSPDREILSSTTSLLHYRQGCETFYPLKTYPDLKPNLFWPGDMTDFEDCFRLLPNHRLDLDTWTTRRFWPVTAREPDPLSEVDRHVSHAVERLRNNMLAIHGTGLTVYSPLTAGRDSRTILACTPAEIRPDITYITLCFEEKGFGYVVDQHIGQLLAKRHNLKHLAVGVSEGSEQDKKQYFYRIGRAGGAGKTSRFYRTPLQSMDMNAIWLTGHGGAVAKRHYSVEARGRRLRLTATELLRRARLPLKEDFLAATDRWIQALPPDCSTELVLDLFYMEYRLGGWGAPHLYGTAPFRVKVIPYSDRRFVDACFSMPYKYRERYQAQGRMIELCDPELLKTPFQQLTGWEKWKRRLRLNRF